MKKLSIHLAVTCAVLISSQAKANDDTTTLPTVQQLTIALDNHFMSTRTPEQLILALDTKKLARSLLRNDTYTSLYDSKKQVEKTVQVKADPVSKKIKNVSKAFKRLTSFRYGKQQKIRAKVGKSSLMFKYTRAL